MLSNRLNSLNWLQRYWLLLIVLFLYISIELSVIQWGIPAIDRIFLYHMDEWHQLMAVRAVRDHFSTVQPGSAHSTMFHFLLSGVYLAVLQFLGMIDVSEIISPIAGLAQQHQLFIWLRLNTIMFGAGAITFLYLTLKKLQLPLWVMMLFVFSPIWLTLSGYFKYDIALIFWLNFSIWLLTKSAVEKNIALYVWAGIPVGLTFATKMSGLPMIPFYGLHYFLFIKEWRKHLPVLLNGVAICAVVMIGLGIPDIALGINDYAEVITDVVFNYPQNTANYLLGLPYWWYLLVKQLPQTFGYSLVMFFMLALAAIIRRLWSSGWQATLHQKFTLWIMLGLALFLVSTLPLKLFVAGNRSLVFLPPITILIGLGLKDWKLMDWHNSWKKQLKVILIIVMLSLQIMQGIAWMTVKWSPDPRQESSEWIANQVNPGSTIGVIGHPIYTRVPDIVLLDFFQQQYGGNLGLYRYQVIEDVPGKLPQYVLLISAEEAAIQKNSLTNEVGLALDQAGYQPVAVFYAKLDYVHRFATDADFLIPNLIPTPSSIVVYAFTED